MATGSRRATKLRRGKSAATRRPLAFDAERRHDDRPEYLNNQLIEHLCNANRTAIQADRREIENSCQEKLWGPIVEDVDDHDAARIDAKSENLQGIGEAQSKTSQILP